MKRMLKNILSEQEKLNKGMLTKSKKYSDFLKEKRLEETSINIEAEDDSILNKSFLINEDLDKMAKDLEKYTQEEKE
jgi:hypothetical protein